eukprot:SAG11_NODE_4252_length_1985_cov_1.644751_3_plen_157_part_00
MLRCGTRNRACAALWSDIGFDGFPCRALIILEGFERGLAVLNTLAMCRFVGVVWCTLLCYMQIYINKQWKTDSWFPTDPNTDVFIVGPPNFYPMLARAPSDAQVVQLSQSFPRNTTQPRELPNRAPALKTAHRCALTCDGARSILCGRLSVCCRAT